MKHVVIIGGGLSGTLCALNLLSANTDTHITIIEKDSSRLNKGAAYSSTLKHQLLNVPAGGMSIYENEPMHFTNWLAAHYPASGYTQDSFVPRNIFGDYVVETFESAKALSGHTINHITASATDLLPSVEGYEITTDDGQVIYASHVVLSTGNEPAAVLQKMYPQVATNPRYIANAWNGNGANNIQQDDSILIIGTGLTMIDQLLSLEQQGHTGKIWMISRNGMLPRPHSAVVLYSIQFEDAHDLSCINNCLQWVKEEINAATNGGANWLSVLNALRDKTPGLWQHLNTESKKRFLRHLKPYWEIHRHRAPAESLDIIQKKIAANSLVKIAGRIKDVSFDLDTFSVSIQTKNKEALQLNTKWIIDCSGSVSPNTGDTLYSNLYKNNIIENDAVDVGITVKQGINNMYLLGPVAKGIYWECTAHREIRKHAAIIASEIYSNTTTLIQ